MEEYGFVYIWRDKGKDRYYIGAHWVTKENDNYICSSTWMRNSIKRRPQDFRRHILYKCNDKEETFAKEYEWLQLIPENELGKVYYNRSIFLFQNISPMKGKKLSPETIEKYRQAQIGKTHSEETKEKMRGKIPWNKGRKMNIDVDYVNPMKGKKMSEESRKKMSIWRLGKTHSEETKEKMRQSHNKVLTE